MYHCSVRKRSLDALKLSKDETELEEMLYNELEDLTLVRLISIQGPRAAVKVICAARCQSLRCFYDYGCGDCRACINRSPFPISVTSWRPYLSLSLQVRIRSESCHRIDMIPSIAFLGWRPRPNNYICPQFHLPGQSSSMLLSPNRGTGNSSSSICATFRVAMS